MTHQMQFIDRDLAAEFSVRKSLSKWDIQVCQNQVGGIQVLKKLKKLLLEATPKATAIWFYTYTNKNMYLGREQYA